MSEADSTAARPDWRRGRLFRCKMLLVYLIIIGYGVAITRSRIGERLIAALLLAVLIGGIGSVLDRILLQP